MSDEYKNFFQRLHHLHYIYVIIILFGKPKMIKHTVPLLFFVIPLLISCHSEDYDDIMDDPLQVMEFNSSSEYIAVFGDIQYYTNNTYKALYNYSCNWILAQKRVGMNINSVLQVGDVTQQNSAGSWDLFRNATKELAEEIPYIAMIGDHDYTWDGATIYDRNSTYFSKYVNFPLTIQKTVAWFEEGRMENIVIENYIHGLPVYFLVLEFGPREEVVDWANEYVESHPDINFILMTHEYMEKGGGLRTEGLKSALRFKNTNTTYTTPTQLWNRLIKKNDNILCVLCGHVTSLYAYTLTENDFGREVPQIQHNIQASAYRYDNWLMLWEFPENSDSVNVQIINTHTLKCYDDKRVLFQFKVSGPVK